MQDTLPNQASRRIVIAFWGLIFAVGGGGAIYAFLSLPQRSSSPAAAPDFSHHSRNRLIRDLASDCEHYAYQHDRAMPPSLDELKSWADANNVKLRTPDLSDFIYLAAGYRMSAGPKATADEIESSRGLIAAICRTPPAPGYYTLYRFTAAPHVLPAEPVRAEHLPEALRLCDAQRAKLNLPPITATVLAELHITPK